MTNQDLGFKKYRVRDGFPLSQKDVDIIGPYLHEVLFPDGKFDKEVAVSDASRPESPLHGYFNWDDKSAAHAYRLNQAQKLFTSFYCVTPDGYEYPSVVNIKVEDSQEYMATARAIESPDLCKQVLQQAIDGLLAWKKRYEMFSCLPEFQGVLQEINLLASLKHKEKMQWQEERAKAHQEKSEAKSLTGRQGATARSTPLTATMTTERKIPRSQRGESSPSPSSL